ncbi:hypothetical protein FB45DRAFT_212645 [Roridomyces roridus]|uniref:Uncharacterized protein n=1 Tax=Roridomyces roridus TaxID=1738132 RepID=A0AAD7CGI0_9AGAR|nr:hypothetical protein FB45DRAFT_212645 [Roridomyces roridus]
METETAGGATAARRTLGTAPTLALAAKGAWSTTTRAGLPPVVVDLAAFFFPSTILSCIARLFPYIHHFLDQIVGRLPKRSSMKYCTIPAQLVALAFSLLYQRFRTVYLLPISTPRAHLRLCTYPIPCIPTSAPLARIDTEEELNRLVHAFIHWGNTDGSMS